MATVKVRRISIFQIRFTKTQEISDCQRANMKTSKYKGDDTLGYQDE